MSLDTRQRIATSKEFRANLAASGLTPDDIHAELGMDGNELAAIVAMEPDVHPARVWLLRDHLDAAIRRRGGEPTPWATMTESRRADAERWFGIAPPPD